MSQPVTTAPLPSAAPQPVTAADPPPRRPAHQSTNPRRFATSDTDQRQPPDWHRKRHQWISGFSSTKPPATATHKPITASTDWWFTATKATQQIFICHRPQCHHLQQPQQVAHASSSKSSSVVAPHPVSSSPPHQQIFIYHRPQCRRPQLSATDRAVDPADDNHHLQQTTTILAFSNHAATPAIATKETQQSNCSTEEESWGEIN